MVQKIVDSGNAPMLSRGAAEPAAPLFVIGDIADRLKVSVRTVRRMRANKQLPEPIWVRRSMRWLPCVIDDWIRNSCCVPQESAGKTR